MSEQAVTTGVSGGQVSLTPESIRELAGAAATNRPAEASAPVAHSSVAHPRANPPSASRGQVGAATRAAPAGSVGTGGHAAVNARSPGGGTAAAGPVEAAATVANACTARRAPIRIGQIGSFSGVLGPINAGGRTGLSVWATAVNAHGGIDCHPVQLFVTDDGADPARTAFAVQDLVETKKVIALVATFTSLTEAALKESAEKFEVPVVGGDVIGFEWNSSPYMFPEGSSFGNLAFGLLKQAADAGLPKIGLLYCVETPTCTTLDGLVEKQAAEAGVTVVSNQPVSITQIDYTAQCQNAKNAGAQVLGVAADGATVSRLVRSCDAIGYRPPIVTGAAILSPGNATDPGIRRDTLLSAAIVAPWMLSDTPGQRAYQAGMRGYAPDAPLDADSIEAWTSGQLFQAAMSRLDPKVTTPTAADVLQGLGRIKVETLEGLTPPLTFIPGKPAPETACIYFIKLDENGWSAPRGTHPVCRG